MASVAAIYSEHEQKFYRIDSIYGVEIEYLRKLRTTHLRYCLNGENLILPSAEAPVKGGKLCYVRIDYMDFEDYEFEFNDGIEGKGKRITDLSSLEKAGIGIGNYYSRRFKEDDGKFVSVSEFCSQTLIDGLYSNSELLATLNSTDLENLCAELFVRRGFKVDLFRASGDGGIDFIALQDSNTDPIIYAVQIKQPEERAGKGRRTVGRPVVQQIYGAAKAWDLHGAILISGSTYSPQAKRFADLKPEEIKVHNIIDIEKWIRDFRWNKDE